MALGPRSLRAGGGGARRAMSAGGPAPPPCAPLAPPGPPAPPSAESPAADTKWYFSREQLAASPSRACGLDADKELAYRQQAANLIQDMGQRLQVTQLCINTAIVYMHRFYTFHSFTQFHRNSMAAAALFLAAKVEEQPRKLEHVIKVSHICLHRADQTSLDVQSQHYKEQAQDLVFNENVLLQTLGFDVAIDHPHPLVVKTCGLVQAPKDLAQTSYFMASNSLHLTTMCLQYRPSVVACFCVHLASKWSSWAIPQSNEGKHWFFYVDRTVTSELLEHLTAEFLHIFDRCPARLKKKIMSITNSQGTNSPQGSSSHSNNAGASSSFDKDTRKITLDDMEKLMEYDKRQQGLFGPAIQNSGSAATSSKMDYREYKERHQQQDRRRPPNVPPSLMPRPGSQDISSGSQPRQSSSSSGQRPPPNIPPSQHRWAMSQRSKDPQALRPHPSQSSRPHHRNSSSALPPQLSSSSQPPSLSTEQRPPPTDHRPTSEHRQLEHKPSSEHRPPPDQRLSSRSQPNPQQQQQQQPILHSSRIHPQAPQPPPQQPSSHQAPQQPPSYPLQIAPSLFPSKTQRKPTSHPRLPSHPLPKELIIPAPLSPFSSSPPPPPIPHAIPEVVPILPIKKIEEATAVSVSIPSSSSSVPQNNIETDPTLLSSLLKESQPHRADKKKKKDKHKHKDREKREDRKKHKKDKDKRRESESNSHHPIAPTTVAPAQMIQSQKPNPLKITIPREALSNNMQPPPQAKLKIKIPKDRLRTEPPMPAIQTISTGLKIKIPKEYVEGSRKRPHDPGMMMDTLPHKAPRLPQQPHQPHKTINNVIMGNGQSGTYK